MFNKIFNKKANKVVNMYRVHFADGSIIEMDGQGVNMMVVHDYDDEIVKIEKI